MVQALRDVDPELLAIVAIGDGAADEAVLKTLYGLTGLPRLVRLPASGRFGIHWFNFRAARLARRRGADLVLSRSIGAAAITAGMGLPTVFECHAPPQGFERRYWRYLLNGRGFRRVVVISHALRRILIEQHPEAADVDLVVAPDGVDMDRFDGLPSPEQAKRESGCHSSRLVACYAGHLYPGRGVEVILALAARLPEWDFIVAGGDDADVEAATQCMRERGLGNVEFWGFVPNAELPRRLAVADVLLMPYQRHVAVRGGRLDSAEWMSPLKMFEYMAMGRAIVASDLPVLREILDEETAVLAAPDRTDDWIRALVALENPDRRAALAAVAKDRAAQYDWSRRVKQMFADLGPNESGRA